MKPRLSSRMPPRCTRAATPPASPASPSRGDVAKGFAEADVVLEETFYTSVQIHVPMETHGSVVKWDGDKVTIWDSTQGVYDAVLLPFARTMGIPINNVRVICRYFGGGFGAKLELGKHTVIAALMARKTGRPVKLMLSREETLLAVGNRPDAKMTLKAGVKKDGTLTALQLTNIARGRRVFGRNRRRISGRGTLQVPECPRSARAPSTSTRAAPARSGLRASLPATGASNR